MLGIGVGGYSLTDSHSLSHSLSLSDSLSLSLSPSLSLTHSLSLTLSLSLSAWQLETAHSVLATGRMYAGLPSRHWGSDHMALACVVALH